MLLTNLLSVAELSFLRIKPRVSRAYQARTLPSEPHYQSQLSSLHCQNHLRRGGPPTSARNPDNAPQTCPPLDNLMEAISSMEVLSSQLHMGLCQTVKNYDCVVSFPQKLYFYSISFKVFSFRGWSWSSMVKCLLWHRDLFPNTTKISKYLILNKFHSNFPVMKLNIIFDLKYLFQIELLLLLLILYKVNANVL